MSVLVRGKTEQENFVYVKKASPSRSSACKRDKVKVEYPTNDTCAGKIHSF